MRLRSATSEDLPRIHAIRHGTTENRLTDPSRVSDAEVAWYVDHAVFLVVEAAREIQGFVCANHQTGYVWALFVAEGMQGRGYGTALLDAALSRLREAGNLQAFLSTGAGTRAEGYYRARGWRAVGKDLRGDVVFRRPLQQQVG